MDVRNCKMCGRLFNVLNNERICPACQKKLEDKFHEVKEYLEEHPGASAVSYTHLTLPTILRV